MEAFMIISDAEYSKNVGGVCIGYSDKHISALLDDTFSLLLSGQRSEAAKQLITHKIRANREQSKLA